MADELSGLMGWLLLRVILFGSVIVALWTLLNGLYHFSLGLIAALGYFLYISYRSTEVNELLIDYP